MPRQLDDAVRNEVLRYWGERKTPKEIAAAVRDNPVVASSGDAAPSVRTIQRWIRDEQARRKAEDRARDQRWYWQFEDGGAGIVLPMLAAIAEVRDGGIDSSALDRPLAERARRLAGEFGDLPPLELYWLATQYLGVESEERRRRRGKEQPWLYVSELRASLDVYLAFTPWRDGGRRYVETLGAGKLGRIRPLRTPSTAAALGERPKTSAIDWPFDLPEGGTQDR